MRRRGFAISGLMALLGGTVLLLAPPAGAQTGYPPGVCTPTSGVQDAGAHVLGETFSITLAPPCVFTPGASVTITVDGQVVGTKTADASGFVTVNITVQAVGAQVRLVVNDPVVVAGRCGPNNVVGVGPSEAARATVTQTATFTVLCPTPAAAVRRGVAFTGANILRWTAIALALVALGALLVTVDRRRTRARKAS